MTRQNRRAITGKVVRDNSIYGVSLFKDGRGVATFPFHYRRRFTTGQVYTGPANPRLTPPTDAP